MPAMAAQWRNTLLVCAVDAAVAGRADVVVPDVQVTSEPQSPMRPDLLALFDIDELAKYYTDAELAGHPGRKT